MSFKIAIASGKGGTGKTTVSVNLYKAFTDNATSNVLLIDCDVEEPNDALFFNGSQKIKSQIVSQFIPQINTNKCTFCKKCVDFCEFNAITILPNQKFTEVNKSLCHSCGACVVACQHNAISEIEWPIGKVNSYQLPFGNGLQEGRLKVGSLMQTLLIKQLKSITGEQSEILLYDAPPGTSCPVVETVADMDYVVLVTEPTPFGLHDLKLIVELLNEINMQYGVIINKAGLGNNDVYTFIEKNNIELLGEIPFDKEYAAAYASGDLLNTATPEFNEKYKSVVEQILRKIPA